MASMVFPQWPPPAPRAPAPASPWAAMAMPTAPPANPSRPGLLAPTPRDPYAVPSAQPFRLPQQDVQEDFGSSLFGGKNKRGFFGGGYYESDPRSYQLPGFDRIGGRYDIAADEGLRQQAAVRAQQQALAQGLFGTLSGQTPSVAQEQLNRTTAQNIGNAYALSQTGPRSGLTAKLANDRAALINQDAVGQGALLRAQEQAQAQGLLGNLLGNQRGQELDLFGQSQAGQAGLSQAQLQAMMERERLQQNSFLNQPSSFGSNLMGAAAGALTPFFAEGGKVPGRAKKKGDSIENDVVPILASAGEIVLPRSVSLAKDAPEQAKLFVMALRKREAKGSPMKRAA